MSNTNPRYPHMSAQVVRLRSGFSDSQLGTGAGGVSDTANTVMSSRTPPTMNGTNVEDVKLRKMGTSPGGANGTATQDQQQSLMMLGVLIAIAFVISRF